MKVTNRTKLTAKLQLLCFFILLLKEINSNEIVEYVTQASFKDFSASSDQLIDFSQLQDDLIETGIRLQASVDAKNQWLRLDLKEIVRVGAVFLFTDEAQMKIGKV